MEQSGSHDTVVDEGIALHLPYSLWKDVYNSDDLSEMIRTCNSGTFLPSSHEHSKSSSLCASHASQSSAFGRAYGLRLKRSIVEIIESIRKDTIIMGKLNLTAMDANKITTQAAQDEIRGIQYRISEVDLLWKVQVIKREAIMYNVELKRTYYIGSKNLRPTLSTSTTVSGTGGTGRSRTSNTNRPTSAIRTLESEYKADRLKARDLLLRPEHFERGITSSRRQTGPVHVIAPSQTSPWDGTQYKLQLIQSLREKLFKKLVFHAFALYAQRIRTIVQTSLSVQRLRSKTLLSLCLRSIQMEALCTRYIIFASEVACRRLLRSKWLRPALANFKLQKISREVQHLQERKALSLHQQQLSRRGLQLLMWNADYCSNHRVYRLWSDQRKYQHALARGFLAWVQVFVKRNEYRVRMRHRYDACFGAARPPAAAAVGSGRHQSVIASDHTGRNDSSSMLATVASTVFTPDKLYSLNRATMHSIKAAHARSTASRLNREQEFGKMGLPNRNTLNTTAALSAANGFRGSGGAMGSASHELTDDDAYSFEYRAALRMLAMHSLRDLRNMLRHNSATAPRSDRVGSGGTRMRHVRFAPVPGVNTGTGIGRSCNAAAAGAGAIYTPAPRPLSSAQVNRPLSRQKMAHTSSSSSNCGGMEHWSEQSSTERACSPNMAQQERAEIMGSILSPAIRRQLSDSTACKKLLPYARFDNSNNNNSNNSSYSNDNECAPPGDRKRSYHHEVGRAGGRLGTMSSLPGSSPLPPRGSGDAMEGISILSVNESYGGANLPATIMQRALQASFLVDSDPHNDSFFPIYDEESKPHGTSQVLECNLRFCGGVDWDSDWEGEDEYTRHRYRNQLQADFQLLRFHWLIKSSRAFVRKLKRMSVRSRHFNMLHRHYQRKVRRQLFFCWFVSYDKQLQQIELCQSIYSTKLARQVLAAWHHHSYQRLQQRRAYCTALHKTATFRHCIHAWRSLYAERMQQLTVNRRMQWKIKDRMWWYWKKFVQESRRRKRAVRVIAQKRLLSAFHEWRDKYEKRSLLTRVFQIHSDAWDWRRFTSHTHFSLLYTVFVAWSGYVHKKSQERKAEKQWKLALCFRGATLLARHFYAWCDLRRMQHARAVRVQAQQQRNDTLRLRSCFGSWAQYVQDRCELEAVLAHAHEQKAVRKVLYGWAQVLYQEQLEIPFLHHYRAVTRRVFDNWRTLRAVSALEDVLQARSSSVNLLLETECNHRKLLRMSLAAWRGLYTRRYRYQEGFKHLDNVMNTFKLRLAFLGWPGRESSIKARNMAEYRRRHSRTRISFIDVGTDDSKGEDDDDDHCGDPSAREPWKRRGTVVTWAAHKDNNMRADTDRSNTRPAGKKAKKGKEVSFVAVSRPTLAERAVDRGYIEFLGDSEGLLHYTTLMKTILSLWDADTKHELDLRRRSLRIYTMLNSNRLRSALRTWVGATPQTSYRVVAWMRKKSVRMHDHHVRQEELEQQALARHLEEMEMEGATVAATITAQVNKRRRSTTRGSTIPAVGTGTATSSTTATATTTAANADAVGSSTGGKRGGRDGGAVTNRRGAAVVGNWGAAGGVSGAAAVLFNTNAFPQ